MSDKEGELEARIESLEAKIEMLVAALCSTTVHPNQLKLF